MGWRWPISGFLVILIIGAGARLGVGGLGGKPIDLLGQLSSQAQTLISSSATASGTTLALMLTLIGFTKDSDLLGEKTLARVGIIAKLATWSLISCVMLLLIMMLPIGDMQGVAQEYYRYIYDGIFAWTVIAVALLVATVLMLFHTIMQIVNEFKEEVVEAD